MYHSVGKLRKTSPPDLPVRNMATEAPSTNGAPNADYQAAWANKYRGATVEDLDPPPALSIQPTDPISWALMSGLERDYTHLTVISQTNRALLGYISIPHLQQLLKEGRVKDTDRVEEAMHKFQRRGRRYKVITTETPLEELEDFFNGGVDGSGKQEFAVVTDASRKFVLGVATRADLENFAKRRAYRPLLPQRISQAWRSAHQSAQRTPRLFPSLQTRWYTYTQDVPKPQTGAGTTTPVPYNAAPPKSKAPFYFEAGYALFAKRPSRPFPPPFLSLPSTSFSEPLSTHNKSRDRRPTVNGQMIRGVTNGDDAVLVSESFIAANDGVGAWATREKGHAALWSRLIAHFWALEVETASYSPTSPPNPIEYLNSAYNLTKEATSKPNTWHGTTTVCGALLGADNEKPDHPLLYVTQLGDARILVIRPSTKEVVYRTQEQWHWFDCPRQLGTNSPDTPKDNAVMDCVEIQEEDVVVAMTDGVVDNLWEHEIVENVCESMEKWNGDPEKDPEEQTYADGMRFVAQQLMNAARVIAQDPFAESPYMERAIDEGLSIEGGKLDDISVVVAQCKRRKG
ncbi:phosphatase 2c [Pyrenophora seminiperda CCB06]|uniref:Phosphatase 2c n=1 Tax=Pyrenophora seminiperda CCB06 TaxID=1302712 RepID=A0A3M7LWS6_9PLEO|nr:phosphatase 2c [Pyrenophora seminiperda CCB06]